MAYRTVAGTGSTTESVRGSRFIGVAAQVDGAGGMDAMLARARSEHPDATHHCWGYRVGNEMRFSDDGEPGGTAGRPILEVILKRGLDRVGIVVVRYFGGTRLGAGGLVRAYGGTAAKALDAAGEIEIEDREALIVGVPFAYVDAVHRLLGETRGVAVSEDRFDAEGWRFTLELPSALADDFRRRLADSTRGSATADAPPEGTGR